MDRQAAATLFAQAREALALGRTAEAEAGLRRLLAVLPDNHQVKYHLGEARLAQGDFAEGFALYESRRFLRGDGPKITQAAWRSGEPWTGQPLAGKTILLLGEQGFGDQIQFVRFALQVRDLGAQVRLCVVPPLLGLFSGLGFEMHPLAAWAPLPEADYWCPLMSLPYRLGVTLETLPSAPYLRTPDHGVGDWSQIRGIGYAWHGSRTHPNDANRSMPSAAGLEALAPDMVDMTEPRGGFPDSAAILDRLDLLITVDTAIAHLAGAMGRPCWVLLPAIGCDWRWLQDRADTPWYPSLRLYRQPAPGDWDSVIAQVRADLARGL
ncbi:hypothetical protein [Phenylobacterium aquaticum]|uniref:hypothetical protein n=1 Tax=Phenylobacterium aquaticum TaxID=1763816 RepID=UPI001F5D1D20|nr:hypothetical protein [Phenylobacterium aquaticum]MCI3135019.1 hypothetical protein [Phenylobacterium aquaticum]